MDEFEQTYARMLASRELKETVINRLAAIDVKSDYHNLIMLTLLQDLVKCTRKYTQGRRSTIRFSGSTRDHWSASSPSRSQY
jgi:hypothetical protein